MSLQPKLERNIIESVHFTDIKVLFEDVFYRVYL